VAAVLAASNVFTGSSVPFTKSETAKGAFDSARIEQVLAARESKAAAASIARSERSAFRSFLQQADEEESLSENNQAYNDLTNKLEGAQRQRLQTYYCTKYHNNCSKDE
jgi:hypothetical protein